MMKKIIISSILFLLFLIVLPFGYLFFFGKHTRYCPLRHKFRDTSSCAVLDKIGDRILIQHADLDINEYYFEIIDGAKSFKYEMPSSITWLAPKGYLATLIDEKEHSILINGIENNLE